MKSYIGLYFFYFTFVVPLGGQLPEMAQW